MKFSLKPYIKNELWQLKSLENNSVYMSIKLEKNHMVDSYSTTSRGDNFLNADQICEIMTLVPILDYNQEVKEIEIELERKNED